MAENVNVVSPTGEIGNLPPGAVQEAIQKYGYRLPTQHEIEYQTLKEKYGEGTANEFKTFAENVAGGLTFNLSKIAENALGISTPQAQAARQQFNPWAAGLGQATGILGGLAVGGLPELVGAGTAEVGARAVGATAATLAETSLTRQIAARTLGGALEGAMYGGIGQSVNEAALGDPTLNAQKVFSNATFGAMLGGGIGAGSSLLGAGLRKGGDWLIGRYGRAAELPPSEVAPSAYGKLADTLTTNPKNPVTAEEAEFASKNASDLSAIRSGGSEAMPTLNEGMKVTPAGAPTIQGSSKFMEDLGKFQQTLEQRELNAQDLIAGSDAELSANELKEQFQRQIEKIKGSGAYEAEGGEQAVNRLEGYMERIDRSPQKTWDAERLRTYLQQLWKDNKALFVPGRDPTLQETALEGVTGGINAELKSQIPGYGDLMDTYSNEVGLFKRLQKQLNWTGDANELPKISNWFDNRVIAPLRDVNVYGKAQTAFSKNLDQFSDVVGRDWGDIVHKNLLYAKLFPEEAAGGQLNTSLTNLLKTGIQGALHPLSSLGKIATNIPDWIQSIQRSAAQREILGEAGAFNAAPGIVNRISDAISNKSDLFKGLSKFLVPEGVTAAHYVLNHDNLTDADQKLETLIAYERARNSADKQIDSKISAIFEPSAKVTEPNEKLTSFLNDQSPAKHGEVVTNMARDLNDLVNNPSLLIQRLGKSIEGLETHAPQLAQGLNMTTARAIQFLSQRMRVPDRRPLDGKFIPSKTDLIQYSKYLRAITNPLSALDEVKRGNLSQETKDVLTNVMPELYDHLKQRVTQGIASTKMPIPQSKRFALSYFLDQDLDSQLVPQTIMKNMAVLRGMRGMPQGMRGASAKNLTIPARLLTPTQEAQQ